MRFDYIAFILSTILYISAPSQVSFVYIGISSAIFLFLAFSLLKDDVKHKDYFSFNVVFTFAFFLATYSFPIFIMGTSSLYDSFVDLSTKAFNYIDFNYITKSVTLSTIAFSVYCIGTNNIRKSVVKKESRLFISPKVSRAWLAIAFIAEMGNIAYTVFGGSFDFNNNPFIFDIYPVLYAICLVSGAIRLSGERTLKKFLIYFKLPLLLTAIVVLSFLYFGERGNAITLVLITMSFYVFFYKKIRLFSILTIAVVGTVLLFAIRETRNKDYAMARGGINEFASASSESINGLSPLLLFSDLIGATQELCYGYEVTERDGFSYPSQIVLLPFYPFPKLPTIVSQFLYGKDPGELYGGSILNKKMSSNIISSFGSHIVSDIYMRWGLIGVLIAFYCFGSVVSSFIKNKYKNMFCSVFFLLLMGMSVYIARSSITDLIRPMAYAYFFTSVMMRRRAQTKL